MSDRLKQERQETDNLIHEAEELGFSIPGTPGWWWDDFDNFGGSLQEWEFVSDQYTYLTPLGKAGARKLIRDEQRRLEEDRRKDIEWEHKQSHWKLFVAGTIIGWIVSILSLTIAIIALLIRSATH
jgi:hypothetical protein